MTAELPRIGNFRDFGGYPTRDGRRVRTGLLFRSQSLHFATDEDLQLIANLGVKLVCDLRSRGERKHAPGRWHSGPDPVRLHLEINTDARAGKGNNEFVESIRSSPSYEGVYRGMLANYRNMPTAFAPVLRELFSRINDSTHLPAVIHCHAGKDRTGFVCAVILAALGVDREHIVEDYLRTEQAMRRKQVSGDLVGMLKRLSGVDFADDALAPMVEVHLEYLDTALQRIDDAYGGMDAYLETIGGLTPERRRQLQELLLE